MNTKKTTSIFHHSNIRIDVPSTLSKIKKRLPLCNSQNHMYFKHTVRIIFINGSSFSCVTSTYNHVGYLHLSSHSRTDSFREPFLLFKYLYSFFLKNHLLLYSKFLFGFIRFLPRESTWVHILYFLTPNSMLLPNTIDTPSMN